MSRFLVAAVLCAALVGTGGCRNGSAGAVDTGLKDTAALESRAKRLDAALADDAPLQERDEPIARWVLPSALAEISGLALTADGRLFSHDDESGRITEIDYRQGTVVKRFFVGSPVLRGDFEGLACVGSRFFLLRSDGTLYEFAEGAAEQQVSYITHDTHLGKECEFESVAWDSTGSSLVLACKNVAAGQRGDELVFYRYGLDDAKGRDLKEFTIPMSAAVGANGWKRLHPTDLTVDPFTGNYVFVAAQEKALVAFTPAGVVTFSRHLAGRHPQAEGIAITRDGILIISDESVDAGATITLYRWP